jgi:hypothetical protein
LVLGPDDVGIKHVAGLLYLPLRLVLLLRGLYPKSGLFRNFWGKRELFHEIGVIFGIAYQERRREGPYDVLATLNKGANSLSESTG